MSLDLVGTKKPQNHQQQQEQKDFLHSTFKGRLQGIKYQKLIRRMVAL